MKKLRVLFSSCLALLVVLITPFTAVADSLPDVVDADKPISTTLVEVDREENGDSWRVTYEIIPVYETDEDGISTLSSRSAWGVVTTVGNKLTVDTMDFDITVKLFNSNISSCYVKFFTGTGYRSLAAHPAGISNTAYMGCQIRYAHRGQYEAYTASVDVYPVTGDAVHQIGVLSLKSFTIEKGYDD